MSNYISVGFLDLWYAHSKSQEELPPPGDNPIDALWDWANGLGLRMENAITDPKVQQWLTDAGIKIENAKIEIEQRKQKREANTSALKWGAAATVVAALFILRKKKR